MAEVQGPASLPGRKHERACNSSAHNTRQVKAVPRLSPVPSRKPRTDGHCAGEGRRIAALCAGAADRGHSAYFVLALDRRCCRLREWGARGHRNWRAHSHIRRVVCLRLKGNGVRRAGTGRAGIVAGEGEGGCRCATRDSRDDGRIRQGCKQRTGACRAAGRLCCGNSLLEPPPGGKLGGLQHGIAAPAASTQGSEQQQQQQQLRAVPASPSCCSRCQPGSALT